MASISLQVAVLISQFRLKHQLKTMKSRESILSLFRMLDRDNNGEVLFLTEIETLTCYENDINKYLKYQIITEIQNFEIRSKTPTSAD